MAKAEGSYAIYVSSETLTLEELHQREPAVHNSRFSLPLTGKRSTNNAAEAMSLLNLVMDLNRIHAFGPDSEVLVHMDSNLTINHFYGLYQLKDQTLRSIHSQIKKALGPNVITLKWIPGEVMKKTIIGH